MATSATVTLFGMPAVDQDANGTLPLPVESSFEERAISPFREMGAYEVLWSDPRTTFKSLAKRFAEHPQRVPSHFVSEEDALSCATAVKERFAEADISRFGVSVNGASEYPKKLRDAAHPVELLYYQGCWDLVSSRCVAVVGTRKPSMAGCTRTRALVRQLVSDNFTVVSGLAVLIESLMTLRSRVEAVLSRSSVRLCLMPIRGIMRSCSVESPRNFSS